MYESFFGFVKRPFLAVSTLDRYFPATSIEQTFQTTARAIQRGEGPVAIFGGTGLGKTMCCLRIAENFRRNFEVVMLASSQLITRRALLQSLLFELRMPYREMSEGELRLTLMNRLQPSTENPSDGLVLIVDEAQTLSIKLLEELRLLTNVVRNGVPRVRLILCGTMRLEESLSHPHMDSMNQRLAARCYLTPLSLQETGQYVTHKIELSGVESASVMTREALDAIYRGSDGIPRLIDQLADQALMLACNDRERPVSAAMVGRAWCMLQQLPNPWCEPESIPKSTPNSTPASVSFGDQAPMRFERLPEPIPASPAAPSISLERPKKSAFASSPSVIEFGQLDEEIETNLQSKPSSLLNSFTAPWVQKRSELMDYDLPDSSAPFVQPALPAHSAPPAHSASSAAPQAGKKSLLDVFAGDFDEEFSIPVQSSGSYQAYSGAAFGNLNYDLSSFGTKPMEALENNRMQIEEANDFLKDLNERNVPTRGASPESNYMNAVSNISPEQAANMERQIEEEMRELVSGLNMVAMTFDPASSIDAFPGNPAFSFESIREQDSAGAQRLAHHAHSDVLSFSSLHNEAVPSDEYNERAAMSDDRDLLVIEDELETVRNGAQLATMPTSRAVLHPYAKLFTKLRNS
jgi:type II secretory pathway predicted ATPase ExeA